MQLKSISVRPASLTGRNILVTGSTSGLGRAVALACARAGATVILSGRNIARLEGVYDEIERLGAPRPAMAPLDLATATAPDYDRLADVIGGEFAQLDGLVHSAAVLGERMPLEQYDVPTWCRVLHVNLTAPFILTQVLLPHLRKSDAASVIFVSSGVARKPRPFWGAYAVAKSGLESASTMFAQELAGVSGVRANSVNPGRLRTAMRASAYPAEDPNSVPSADSVADAFVYLLCPDSRDVSGECIDLA
ncbi:MAG: YciK family oxidoreductase [Steroidobacterales bacterium]